MIPEPEGEPNETVEASMYHRRCLRLEVERGRTKKSRRGSSVSDDVSLFSLWNLKPSSSNPPSSSSVPHLSTRRRCQLTTLHSSIVAALCVESLFITKAPCRAPSQLNHALCINDNGRALGPRLSPCSDRIPRPLPVLRPLCLHHVQVRSALRSTVDRKRLVKTLCGNQSVILKLWQRSKMAGGRLREGFSARLSILLRLLLIIRAAVLEERQKLRLPRLLGKA